MEKIVMNGKTYEFPEVDFSDLEVSESVARGSELSAEYKEKMDAVDKSNLSEVVRVMREYCEEMIDIIDEVLGEGTSDLIFEGHTNFGKITDVFAQIQDGVTEAFQRSRAEMEARAANRAQRRAAANKPQNITHGVKTGKHAAAQKKPVPKVRVLEPDHEPADQ